MWLKSSLPWEVIEYRLCRYVYHCLPSQLREQDWDDIQRHLAVMSVEEEVAAYD